MNRTHNQCVNVSRDGVIHVSQRRTDLAVGIWYGLAASVVYGAVASLCKEELSSRFHLIPGFEYFEDDDAAVDCLSDFKDELDEVLGVIGIVEWPDFGGGDEQ